MARKKWSPNSIITPSLINLREKRKWQIALRRYVLERNLSSFYAPYFGLDIETMRKWFEIQFEPEITWDDFGKKWQFAHIIPVTYFDFSSEAELKLCWNFINIRVESYEKATKMGNWLDVLAAKAHFEKLYKKTLYPICRKMLEKIDQLEISEKVSTKRQAAFIIENRSLLDLMENYKSFEFELLNTGKDISEVKKEMDFLKKFEK